uniref:Uncharacterized protein n=1 Tax=Arundo donax TaxID=35708 RepID=A0A0A8YCW5_ARUDO
MSKMNNSQAAPTFSLTERGKGRWSKSRRRRRRVAVRVHWSP